MSSQKDYKENSTAPTLSDSRVQALLVEYRRSSDNASHLEDSIWNTAAVLVTGSIAGLALIGGNIPDSPRPYDYVLRAAIGVISIVLVFWWKKMSSVWYSVQNILYFRIVEIEEELDLYSESYIIYSDKALRGIKYPERPRVSSMISALKDQCKPLNVPSTVNRIGWFLILVWLFFLASQVVAMVGWI